MPKYVQNVERNYDTRPQLYMKKGPIDGPTCVQRIFKVGLSPNCVCELRYLPPLEGGSNKPHFFVLVSWGGSLPPHSPIRECDEWCAPTSSTTNVSHETNTSPIPYIQHPHHFSSSFFFLFSLPSPLAFS